MIHMSILVLALLLATGTGFAAAAHHDTYRQDTTKVHKKTTKTTKMHKKMPKDSTNTKP